MNQHKITFSLNIHTKITIELEDALSTYHPYSNATVILTHNQQDLILCDGSLYENSDRLRELLSDALYNKLPLHKSINQDIGFLYNQYCDFIRNPATLVNSHFECIQSGPIDYWVGDYYHLWAKKYVSWIYNNNDGDIIFEVTPFYPYSYCDPQTEPNFITYDQWIKTYQPYLIATFSKETAQEWLDQTKCIIKTIDENN